MDMAGYSVDLRRALARIARIQGNQSAEAMWSRAADDVVARVKTALWRPELRAMYDRCDLSDTYLTRI